MVSLISPYKADRDAVRKRHEDMGLKFIEVLKSYLSSKICTKVCMHAFMSVHACMRACVRVCVFVHVYHVFNVDSHLFLMNNIILKRFSWMCH